MRRMLTTIVLATLALAGAALSAQSAYGQSAQDFTDWTAVAGNVATGTLRGSAVTLSGTNVSPFPSSTLDGSSLVFGGPDFTPPLPASDAIQINGATGNAYTLQFATPVTDPVIHFASIASVIHFAPGTVITRLSGDAEFSVTGADVVGGPDPINPTDDANGSVRLSGTFGAIPFTTTFAFSDGIFVQVGAAPPAPPAPPPPPPPPPPPAVAPDFTLAFGGGADEFSTLSV